MKEPWPDGWHDLPCGAAVQVKKGSPNWLSDRGRKYLDEALMLKEASARFEVPLHFASVNRAWRWRGRSALRWLGLENEAIARLAFGPCEVCGNDAAVVRVQERKGVSAPVCRRCGTDIEAGRITLDEK